MKFKDNFENETILSTFCQARFRRPMKIITPNKKHLCDFGHYLSLKLIFMKFGTRGLSNDVISGTYQTFCEKLLSYWHCSWAHLFEYFNFDNWISNLTCSCKF